MSPAFLDSIGYSSFSFLFSTRILYIIVSFCLSCAFDARGWRGTLRSFPVRWWGFACTTKGTYGDSYENESPTPNVQRPTFNAIWWVDHSFGSVPLSSTLLGTKYIRACRGKTTGCEGESWTKRNFKRDFPSAGTMQILSI